MDIAASVRIDGRRGISIDGTVDIRTRRSVDIRAKTAIPEYNKWGDPLFPSDYEASERVNEMLNGQSDIVDFKGPSWMDGIKWKYSNLQRFYSTFGELAFEARDEAEGLLGEVNPAESDSMPTHLTFIEEQGPDFDDEVIFDEAGNQITRTFDMEEFLESNSALFIETVDGIFINQSFSNPTFQTSQGTLSGEEIKIYTDIEDIALIYDITRLEGESDESLRQRLLRIYDATNSIGNSPESLARWVEINLALPEDSVNVMDGVDVGSNVDISIPSNINLTRWFMPSSGGVKLGNVI